MELKSPTRKGLKTPAYHSPLPIWNDASSNICSEEDDWPMFTGQYNGSSVIIDHPHEILTLSRKGCFGKGSLSKGYPRSGKRKLELSVLSESQWKRRKEWHAALSERVKGSGFPTPNTEEKQSVQCEAGNGSEQSTQEKTPGTNDEIKVSSEGNGNKDETPSIGVSENEENQREVDAMEVVEETQIHRESKNNFQKRNLNLNKNLLESDEVLVISDIENNLHEPLALLNPHIEKENVKTVIEVLYLSLEEAFFLSYGLNCLQVVDLTSHFLDVKDMWMLFLQSQADFIEKYVAYHHFRSKGWVVKSGIKFGGDFLLYKKGPQYYHASYVVLVQLLNPDGTKESTSNSLTWKKAIGLNRMVESATKEILILQVQKPDVPKEMFFDPSILKQYRVNELLVRRWQATIEKE